MQGYQYKAVPASAAPATVKDHGDGLITAYVSVTGVEDNVKDVIEPGAYTDTLQRRTPKGVWSHDWTRPISRTEDVAELPPGHPDLPKELPNGKPWPKEAGAVKVDTQFNLASSEGHRAYQDVKFFGDQQEWSIGYKVPEGGATYDKKTGVRHIHRLDWFEYSPVLFGAMPHARTKTVADAQLAYKSLNGVDVTDIVEQLKKWENEGYGGMEFKEDIKAAYDFEGDEEVDVRDLIDDEDKGYGVDEEDYEEEEQEDDEDEDEEDEEDEGDDEDEEEDEDEYKNYGGDEEDEDEDYEDEDEEDDEDEEEKGLQVDTIRAAIGYLEEIESKVAGYAPTESSGYERNLELEEKLQIGAVAYLEAKAVNYDCVTDAVEDIDLAMSKSDEQSIVSAAMAFDDASSNGDKAAAEQAATELLDVLEVLIKGSDGDAKSAQTVARVIADKMHKMDEDEDREDDEDYEDEEDEEKVSYVDELGIETKNFDLGDRQFGFPREVEAKVEVYGEDGVRAFIGGLDNDTLLSLDMYLEGTEVDDEMKGLTFDEIETRIYVGNEDLEEKRQAFIRTALGVAKYGGRIGDLITRDGAADPKTGKLRKNAKSSGDRAPVQKPAGVAKKASAKSTAKKSSGRGPQGGGMDPNHPTTPKKSSRGPQGGGMDPNHPTSKRAGAKKPAAKKAAPKKTGAALDHEEYMASVPNMLKGAKSREQAHRVLQDLTMAELRKVAGDIKMPNVRARNKQEMRDNIVQFSTGSRLDSEAIREGARGMMSGNRRDRRNDRVSTETDPAEAERGMEEIQKLASARDEYRAMRRDREQMWERYTPSERRAKIRKDIAADPSLERELDRPEEMLKNPRTAKMVSENLRRHFAELSSWWMGVVSPEEYESQFFDMRAERMREQASAFGSQPEGDKKRGRLSRITDAFRRKDEELWALESKRDIGVDKREELGKKGHAFKNANGEWSYPIETEGDLKNAIHAFGRSIESDKPSLKSYIIGRAKALGCPELVPEDWTSKKDVIDLTELKSLEDFLASTKSP